MNPFATAAAFPLAPLKRRLACAVYEMLLLLGVLALGFLVPHLALGVVLHYTAPGWFLNLHLLAVIGAYFVWYWTHGGQTLAMQTWKIRLVRVDGGPVNVPVALLRYGCACLWLVPAVLLDALIKPSGSQHVALFFCVGLCFAPLTALIDPERQFLHDRLAGTRLTPAAPAMPETGGPAPAGAAE
ncbi:MAG: RDD family protein [Candidatus Protistobacter heckmanni]|nr:RDD family protein [Candidatus Protistobacter heckmanni]